MPIGIIDDDEFEVEVDNCGTEELPQAKKVTNSNKGRGEGNNAVPEVLREIGAEASLIQGNESAAQLVGVSPSSISAYKVGAHSTASYKKPDKSLLGKVNKQKRRISKRASRVLNMSLDAITPDKLEECSPRVNAGIARDMATVMHKMEETTDQSNNNGTQFVFFTPELSKTKQYEVIDVKE